MSYKDRDKNLLGMGYTSYPDYLQSELWKGIRQNKLKRCKFKCRVCGEHTTILHHISYDISVLQGRNTKKLVALCPTHHHSIEFRPDGTKTSHAEANRNLALLLNIIPLKRVHKVAKDIPVPDGDRLCSRGQIRKKKQKIGKSRYCSKCDSSFSIIGGVTALRKTICPKCGATTREYIYVSQSAYLRKCNLQEEVKRRVRRKKNSIAQHHANIKKSLKPITTRGIHTPKIRLIDSMIRCSSSQPIKRLSGDGPLAKFLHK